MFSQLTLDKSSFNNHCNVKPDLSVKYTSGLLLGLRRDVNKNTSTYRTLWIAPDKDNKLKVIKEMDFIIVPHKDSFWQIEPVHYSFTNTKDSIEYPVAHAISHTYTPETFEYKYSTYSSKLNFVDRNHVSISTYRNSHPSKRKVSTNNTCSVVNLEQLTNYRHTEDKITMYNVFKDKSIPVIRKYKKEKITLGECSKENSTNTTLGNNWAIGRKDGKWIALIGKTFKYSENSSNYILYNTDLELPQSIVSYNELCTSFSSIKNIIPEAQDAISSPHKDILGIFTPNKLSLYPYFNDCIGNSALDINLKDNERMIMAQWTNGNYIEDWTKTFNTAFPENN
jgi:hypothetical protein